MKEHHKETKIDFLKYITNSFNFCIRILGFDMLYESFKSIFTSNLLEDIGWILKLYCLQFVIPIVVLIVLIFAFILGIDTKRNFFEFLEIYYYNGNILGVLAWRIHIAFLVICAMFHILEKDR